MLLSLEVDLLLEGHFGVIRGMGAVKAFIASYLSSLLASLLASPQASSQEK